jgi:nucleoside-diphosphate-sugar epimerase
MTCHRGDLGQASVVDAAVSASKCTAIIHVAAKAGVWGPYEAYHQANVVGTRNLLAAAKKRSDTDTPVRALVFTSSPSVIFDGTDEVGIDESVPYPKRHLGAYSRSKAVAEQAVLRHDVPGLKTNALRPHLVWGPGDQHLIPRLAERARAGKVKLVGDGSNRIDTTYIDNAVDAHLAALTDLLAAGRSNGKAYFISNAEPLPIKEVFARLLATQDLPPVTRRVPPWLAYAAGSLLEGIGTVLHQKREPLMTRFVARQLATEHYFDLAAAARDLDWHPRVSFAAGCTILREYSQP